jgi:hypothetical protein
MANHKRTTHKSTRGSPKGLVTIAFKRTFIEGDLDGISIHGMTRQVTAIEAARLIAARSGFGQDGDGNRAVDTYVRIVAAGTDPLVLEKQELVLEKALLTRALARLRRRERARKAAPQVLLGFRERKLACAA